jgi:predicted CopG family antitoxin
MGSTTISLERSAYESLRHAKLPGESFSQTVRRLTRSEKPSLRELAGIFPKADVDAMAAMIETWRQQDVAPPSGGVRRKRKADGNRARQ